MEMHIFCEEIKFSSLLVLLKIPNISFTNFYTINLGVLGVL